MKTECCEFAPLDMERAKELEEIVNRAALEQKAVIVDADEGGITGSAATELLSPSDNTNALVRYQRHY